jgi:hypothetical protein
VWPWTRRSETDRHKRRTRVGVVARRCAANASFEGPRLNADHGW